MKRICTIITSVFLIVSLKAQSNFSIERSDTIPMTKAQIYDEAKRFISEYWNSEDAIKNDDKETGIIMVKGLIYKTINYQFEHKYIYSYVAKFLMKEKKYKIIIDHVECISAICEINVNCQYVDLCDGCEYHESSETYLNERAWRYLMNSVKSELVGIADKYEKYLKSSSPSSPNW